MPLSPRVVLTRTGRKLRIGEESMRKPKNVREFMLQEKIELMEGFITTNNHFTGPNTVVRRGEWENVGMVIPFVEKIKFRPDAKGRNVFVNVRNAVNHLDFDLFAGWGGAEDEFTGPDTVIRRGEWEIEIGEGIEIPFVATIKFGRPRLSA
jgi:hypothetical protein